MSTSLRTSPTLIYGRVSTTEQDFSREETELRDYASRTGWEVVEYIGSYHSGGSNDSVLNRIKELASRGKFDILMVWELYRLSRKGPGSILTLLQQFEAWRIRVWSHQETWPKVDGPARTSHGDIRMGGEVGTGHDFGEDEIGPGAAPCPWS